jgi:hypothetical protein
MCRIFGTACTNLRVEVHEEGEVELVRMKQPVERGHEASQLVPHCRAMGAALASAAQELTASRTLPSSPAPPV